nr:uncharacterized protein LOC101237298 isoform X1 [Hydra vulgaris]XP_047124461.1 uncharacterized protein LOC101237298 isoform X1 [Hydra vulgaris]XP_047124462.1 uncharacterized protein LOC101237298 isoform X1 [Hydra vulgaris]
MNFLEKPAPSGNPEIYWSSHTEGSPVGGLEMGFHGKKFASGFKIRFFSKESSHDPPWETYAVVDRNKSNLHACVFKVPAYYKTHITTNVSVFIEVQSGSEKEPRTSEPVLFTYLADSKVNSCKICVQLKGFIQTIYQLLISKHNFKGILKFLQNIIKEHNINTQFLTNNSLENHTSEVFVSCHNKSPLTTIKTKTTFNPCTSGNKVKKMLDNSGFSSELSINCSKKLNTSAADFSRASPRATCFDTSQSKLFYTDFNRNEQTSVTLNNTPTQSTSFSQSYNQSNNTYFAENYQNEKNLLKRDQKENILRSPDVSDIRNIISTKVSNISSKLFETSCEKKEIIGKSFSTTSSSNSSCEESLMTLDDCLHNEIELASCPTHSSQHSLTPESFYLKSFDHDHLFCSSLHLPSLKCLENNQDNYLDSQCDENLLIDKYYLQDVVSQSFEYNFQPFSKSYEKVRDQIVQPRSYVLCHEPTQNSLNQHAKFNAILMQNNFPVSSNRLKRKVDNFAAEYNFYNSLPSDQSLSFEAGNSFFKVLDGKESAEISSTSRPTFCSGNLSYLDLLGENIKSTPLSKLEQANYSQCFLHTSLLPNSSPISW